MNDICAFALRAQVLNICLGQSVVTLEEEDMSLQACVFYARLLCLRLSANEPDIVVEVEVPKKRAAVQPVVVGTSCFGDCLGAYGVASRLVKALAIRGICFFGCFLLCGLCITVAFFMVASASRSK